jgi:multisubunit Na+/H+ antiporter MnhC subunit
MAISMALTYFFGLFIGLAMSIGIFILLSMYIRKKAFRGAVSGGMFGGGINYVCIACGHRFKGGSCPRCGSKMRRAEF